MLFRSIGQRVVYRLARGSVVPYYSRADIDEKGALVGRGLELAWLADPLDRYFLHVQGSGRLHFTDGSEQPVAYAGTNGRSYVSIGRHLADLGLGRLEEIAFDEPLDEGAYDCVVIYHLIDEDQNTLSTLRIALKVIVEG